MRLTKKQIEALRLVQSCGRITRSNRTRTGAVCTLNSTAAANLQKLGLIERVFDKEQPSIWEILHHPVVLSLTRAGTELLASLPPE